MKTVNDYLELPYKMEIVKDPYEGGYVVSFPELRGCLTCADTIEEAIDHAADAKKEWFAAALEMGLEIPEPDALMHYSGQFNLRIPKSLHRQLAEHSKKEGISMNQYCVYLLTKYDTAFSAQA